VKEMTSTNGRFLLGLLLGAILGGGAAYLVTDLVSVSGTGSPAPALEGPSLPSISQPDAGTMQPRTLPDLSSREVVRPVDAAIHRTLDVSEEELGSLLASVDASEIQRESGDGAIFG